MDLSPFFTYTKSEKRGILVLIIVIIILVVVRIYIPFFFGKSKVTEYELAYLNEVEIKSDTNRKNGSYKKVLKLREEKKQQLKKPIDPNSASYNDLVSVGFSSFISSNIIKYRNSGGRFTTSSDIYKIYGIDSSHFELINQYILIVQDSLNIQKPKQKEAVYLNINDVNAFELEYLPGIGPVLGKRIIKYRKLLGGFVDKNQINEVYGVSDSIFIKIEPFLLVEPEKCKKIDLNQVAAKELYKHPYISKYQAHAIIEYREVYGKFTAVDELILNNLLDEQSFKKIEQYLTIK